MRNSNVFLDKLCIHQGDETIKMAGIKDLSRCLQISKTLTVLCSQDYFERLWCVYEIAQCASGPRAVAAGGGGTTDSSGRAGANTGGTVVEILPTWVAPFLLSMLLTNVAVMFFAFLLQSSPLYLAVLDTFGAIGGICIFWGIVGFAPAIISCSVVRDEVVGHSHSCHAIANFDLDKTKVTFESDREIVYGEIRSKWGSCTRFELYVRSSVLQTTEDAVGRPGEFPYSWGIFIMQPYLWYSSTDSFSVNKAAIAATDAADPTFLKYFTVNLIFYFLMMALLPLALRALARWCQKTATVEAQSVGVSNPIVGPVAIHMADVVVYLAAVLAISAVCMVFFEWDTGNLDVGALVAGLLR